MRCHDLLTVLVMCVLLVPLSSAQCVSPIGTATGWWRLNNDVTDSTPNGHHGTAVGTPTFGPAVLGDGIIFDSNDDGVDIPHHADLDIPVGGAGFSVSFFMRGIHNQPHTQFLVVDKSHGWSDSTGWLFQGGSSTGVVGWALGAGGSSSTGFVTVGSSVDLLDDEYHHVVGRWDATSGVMELFVDGQSQGTNSIATPAGNTRPVRIGYSWGGGAPLRFFRGSVDELAIYAYALSAEEIAFLASPLHPQLALSQDMSSFDICVAGAPGLALFLVHSFDPANQVSPGSGIWGGLHIGLSPLVDQLLLGLSPTPSPVFGGVIPATGIHHVAIPTAGVGFLSTLQVWTVGYVAGYGGVAGFTNIEAHTFL